ncbi:prepilin-type N-terminal cleavage/methylation domain-containing protein [Desulfohalotomaculum tongense]|uniref:prepilin-type N-terminal cleavage/methylation domain-containing protein n=1 Tax=Desulforadius tongensis TaxID=1216062 RepID=UPI00195B1650|nr:prepilin-type N-terminal cleavage/methylation domain-containing protein [Desulforadius tongensis]
MKRKIEIIKSLFSSEKGFSLVELMMALALMGLALAGIYNIFFFAHSSFNHARLENQVLQEVNLFLTTIGAEINSAQRPNDSTEAVAVNGNGIDIYRVNKFTNNWERIQYRIAHGKLQRRSAELSEELGTWQTVVSGVDNTGIFQVSPVPNFEDCRRVSINLKVSGAPTPLNKPLEISTVFISRSRGGEE